jgi:hypothetical protein
MAAVSLGVLMALIAALAFPANGWAVEEDITPPQVDELSVSPTAVDVTAAQASCTEPETNTPPRSRFRGSPSQVPGCRPPGWLTTSGTSGNTRPLECISPEPGAPPKSCTLAVFKNGVQVPTCTSVPPEAISPDPCIVAPQQKVGSETKLTIYSTTASTWNVGIDLNRGGAEVTELTTTLSGGGQSGAKITVPGGAAVTDSATLSGANASEAEGTVECTVYSDSACSELVASAGTVSVEDASVPASKAETLLPGVYYWQASYSGDSSNAPSKSKCVEEQLTVVSSPRETPVNAYVLEILAEGAGSPPEREVGRSNRPGRVIGSPC